METRIFIGVRKTAPSSGEMSLKSLTYQGKAFEGEWVTKPYLTLKEVEEQVRALSLDSRYVTLLPIHLFG